MPRSKNTSPKYREHKGSGQALVRINGEEFYLGKYGSDESWGPTTTNNHLRLCRVLFKYANDIEATDRTIRYHIGLKGVPKSKVRKHQAEQPAREFTLAEIHRLLDRAQTPMRAFILLGLNCAYGTADISRLRVDQIDFDGQWLGEARGKTGIARGCWLWPETIKALREAIDAKPWTGNEKLGALFSLTRSRRPWSEDGANINPLAQASKKIKDATNIKKDGVGHYALRHTFATLASDAGDQQAVDFIMGHHDASISAVYREGIDPKRVKAVCQFVRKKFRAATPKKKGGAK